MKFLEDEKAIDSNECRPTCKLWTKLEDYTITENSSLLAIIYIISLYHYNGACHGNFLFIFIHFISKI